MKNFEASEWRKSKSAMCAQFLGFSLNAYDLSLVLVMAPVLTTAFAPPAQSQAWRYIMIVITYSISLVARPLGSAVFGHFADTIGRRLLFILALGGVGAASFASALLPTSQQIGKWAYVSFCLVRFFMGCCFGGEQAVGHTFAIEHAPQKRRGLIGGFVQSGFPAGYLMATLVFTGISSAMDEEAMIAYGWRIMFATGVLPILLSLTLYRLVLESPEFERMKVEGGIEKTPFVNLFKPPTLRVFLHIFVVMTGFVAADYAIYGFLPNLLTLGGRGFNITTYSRLYAVTLVCAIIGYNLFGWLSDKVGRSRLLLYYCIFLVLFGIPLYRLLYIAALQHSVSLAIIGVSLIAMLKLAWGIIPAYLAESFPTQRRAVGLGFGYTSGLFLGAWFSIYVLWVHSIGYIATIEKQDMWLSPAVVLMVGAMMAFVSLLFSPNVRNLNLAKVRESQNVEEPDICTTR